MGCRQVCLLRGSEEAARQKMADVDSPSRREIAEAREEIAGWSAGP